MRGAALVLFATACGRVSFDVPGVPEPPEGDGGITGDPRGDAGFPATCTGEADCGGCGECVGNACVAFDFQRYSFGVSSIVGVTSDGTYWGWGDDPGNGLQLGEGSFPTPTRLSQIQSYGQVVVGHYGGAGYGADGSVWSWLGTDIPRHTSTLTGWSNLQVAWGWACAVRPDQTLWCWGDNYYYSLGDGTEIDRSAPIQINVPAVSRYSINEYLGCVIDTSGRLWCWGENQGLSAGNPSSGDMVLPAQVGTDSTWAEVTSGGNMGCAMHAPPSAVSCWGLGYSNGMTASTAVPTPVDSKTDYMMVRSNFDHTCALDAGGAVWCWGQNGEGELATGDTHYRVKPRQVTLPGAADDVLVGGFMTCAHVNNSWWCWGANDKGQQGLGAVSPNILSPYERCP